MNFIHRTLLVLALASPAYAASLPTPESTPILIVSGKIKNTNFDGTAQFDRAMLEDMTSMTFETKTPWHDGVVRFEGVPVAELMEAVGAYGETLTAIALNDYVTDIPMSDFSEFGVMLALKQDGEYLSVRDKGPLFIVYPFDSSSDLQSQTYFGRSAWQISEMIVK